MKNIDTITGQKISSNDKNDNRPSDYSSPSELFKKSLKFHANLYCARCNGSGYIGNFKRNSGGRCFQCIPDARWNALLGDLILTGTDNNSGEPVCEIRRVTSETYSSSGYIVTRIGLPPTKKIPIFSTTGEACEFAKKIHNV